MSSICLYLLGAPRLELDGRVVDFDTRKALALMAYLAIAGEPRRRETLAALLWPEYDHSHALGALRRTLSSLKASLCEECLQITRETVGIANEANLWSDVSQFRSILKKVKSHQEPQTGQPCPGCVESLVEAVHLYRDHFMAGFSLRDSPEFDDWQFFQSETLRQELAGALERLVSSYIALGDFDTSISYAQRWLALDNLHEPAHRRLMQLYAWSGRRAAALHQYQECVRILDTELGVPPLEETTRLYEEIQQNKVSPPPTVIHTQAASDLRSAGVASKEVVQPGVIPLVGRQVEWQALQQAYQVVNADGHFAVIEGEAGIGKTRLAEEFLDSLRRSGGSIFSARCYEGESHLAYAPFLEGLRVSLNAQERHVWWKDLSSQTLSEASRLVPEIGQVRPDLPPPPLADGPGAQNRFFESVSQVLLALCSPAEPSRLPGVIFIDDAQWIDEASLDLLTFLVRRLHRRPALVLVTWRDEDLPGVDRLRRLLAEAERGGRATHLRLSRLSEDMVKDLVRLVAVSQTPSPELSQRLFRESEGLPYFLVEYLRLLDKDEKRSDLQNWSMPFTVRDLLRSRLASLGETAGQVLQAAAVIGRAFDYDILRLASGRSEEETVAALEELVGRGLIREYQPAVEATADSFRGPVNDFSHDKLRLLVYEDTSLARRRLLHRRVAEALASHSRQEIPALSGQIAYHYRQAGSPNAAAEYYRIAGQHAQSLYANAEALAHYRNALALGHPERAGLNEVIGDLQLLQGDYGASRTSYSAAIALYTDKLVDLARLEHKLGDLHHRLGDWDRAERHFKSSLEATQPTGGRGDQAGILSDWSRTALHRGEIERALEIARRALSLSEETGDPDALSQAHNILGIIARNGGDLQGAEYHLQMSLSFAEKAGKAQARVAALNNLALVHADRNDLPKAVEAGQAALQACILYGDRHREAALHNNLADLYHAAGEAGLAMDHLKKAVAIFSEVGKEDGEVNPEIWKLMEW